MIKHVLFDAPRKVKRVAYLTLCRPILEYASEVWDPYLIRLITSLEDIQKKGVRFISGISGRQSVTETRVCLKLDLLETSRRKTARMKLMMQILTNQKHVAFMQCFQKLQDFNHSFNTRSIANRAPAAIHDFINIVLCLELPVT